MTPPADLIIPVEAPPPPPGAPAEKWNGNSFLNVTKPELYVYLNSDKSKAHPAIIICPGGAYTHIAFDRCVDDWVGYWRSQGFVVLGLKYRLIANGITDRRKDAVYDLGQALKLAHQHATEWNIDTTRIGLWGGSAGSNAILNYLCDATSGATKSAAILPRFAVTLSPWPGRQKLKDFTFSSTTPPIFFASARDDTTAPEAFAHALSDKARAANPADFYYVVDKGGHPAFTTFKLIYPEDDWKPSFLAWVQKVFQQTK